MKKTALALILSFAALLCISGSDIQASPSHMRGPDCQAVYNQAYIVNYNYAIRKLNYDEFDAANYARHKASVAQAKCFAGDS